MALPVPVSGQVLLHPRALALRLLGAEGPQGSSNSGNTPGLYL